MKVVEVGFVRQTTGPSHYFLLHVHPTQEGHGECTHTPTQNTTQCKDTHHTRSSSCNRSSITVWLVS